MKALKIRSVKSVGYKTVCDISVDVDHSYITRGGIIHHNTTNNFVKPMFIAPEDHFFAEYDLCLPGDTRVSLERGLVRMDQINEGDRIILQSIPHFVEKAWSNGIKPVYELVTNTGRRIRATGNHPFKTPSGFRRLDSLKTGDTLFLDTSLVDGPLNIPPDEAYLAGLFYGDGCYSQNTSGGRRSYRLAFSAGLDREEYLNQIRKVFPDTHISTSAPEPKAVFITNKNIHREWSDKYPKKGSRDMGVPERIWASSRESKLHFIGGLIDSDGSVNSGRLRYTSMCEGFIDDLLVMGNSVGVYGIKEVRGPVDNPNFSWVVYSKDGLTQLGGFSRLARKRDMIKYWVDHKAEDKCRTEMVPEEVYQGLILPTKTVGPYHPTWKTLNNAKRKSRLTRWAIRKNIIPELVDEGLWEAWVGILDYRYEQVKSITPHGHEEVYDITVRNAHSFTANGLVVHNSQAELRIAAELSQDPVMIDIFKQGRNIHVATAAEMFNLPYEEVNRARKDEDHPDHLEMVKKHKAAKVLNFTIFYGAGPETVGNFISKSTGDKVNKHGAIEFIEKWFDAFPTTANWIKKEQRKAVKNGFVVNPFGRKRRLYIFNDKANKARNSGGWQAALRNAINAPIQGGASDVTQWINIQVHRAILDGRLPSYLWLKSTVHDSLEFYVHKSDVHRVSQVIFEIGRTLPDLGLFMGYDFKHVEMKISGEFGINWGRMHEYNPKEDYEDLYKREWEAYNKEPYPHTRYYM